MQGGSGRGWELSSPDPNIHLKNAPVPSSAPRKEKEAGLWAGFSFHRNKE